MKKIHRFLIDSLPLQSKVVLSDERILHQTYHVLRLQPKEHIVLFADGSDDVEYEIITIDKKELALKKIAFHPIAAPKRHLIAALCIAKRDAFELMVQKLTEIGVSEIIPIQSAHTVKQSVRIDRLELISNEALEQCGGTKKVHIHDVTPLSVCITKHHDTPSIYFDTVTTNTALHSYEKVLMYIGPEGGWSDEERALFAARGIHSISLGGRVLRTETAAIVGAHKILWS